MAELQPRQEDFQGHLYVDVSNWTSTDWQNEREWLKSFMPVKSSWFCQLVKGDNMPYKWFAYIYHAEVKPTPFKYKVVYIGGSIAMVSGLLSIILGLVLYQEKKIQNSEIV